MQNALLVLTQALFVLAAPNSGKINLNGPQRRNNQRFLIRAQRVDDVRDVSMVVGVLEYANQMSYTCSGVIVSDQHIVTAAHCITNFLKHGCNGRPPASNFRVKIGFQNLWQPDVVGRQETFSIDRYDIPTGFNACTYDVAAINGKDIAVLTLTRRIPEILFTNRFARKVFLPSSDQANIDINLPLKAVAFGTEESGTYGTLRLCVTHQLEMHTCQSERDRLKTLLENGLLTNLPPDAMCTKSECILCEGDSGGPLMIENKDSSFTLIGIASITAGCDAQRTDGTSGDIYTRVVLHLDWIHSILNLIRF